MAKIPTLVRQQGLPGNTGIRPLSPGRLDNYVGQAVDNFGQKTKAVGDDLVIAQANAEVTSANTAAQIKLAQLETELSTMDGLQAQQVFGQRAQAIHDEVSSVIATPEGKNEFAKTWQALAAKSQITVQANGTKRKYDQLNADLLTQNDALLNLVGTPGMPANMIETTGVNNINRAVASGVISFEEGAKRVIEFRQDVAKNGIAAWVNNTSLREGANGLLGIYDQMDAGVLQDREANTLWSSLNATEQETIRNRVATEIRSLQSAKDAQERKDEKVLKDTQESNFGSIAAVLFGVQAGDIDILEAPTIVDLETMKREGRIDGNQQKTLTDMLVGLREPKTDATELFQLQNEIYAIADLPASEQSDAVGKIKRKMFELSGNGQLEPTDGTSLLGLIDKVGQREFKHAPEVRARKSLLRILGGQDAEFSIPGFDSDPGAQARVQRALDMYDARIEAGEKPWSIHRDLIRRASVEAPQLNTFVTPMYASAVFGSASDLGMQDVATIISDTREAFERGEINAATFNIEMENLSGLQLAVSARDALNVQADQSSEDVDLERRSN